MNSEIEVEKAIEDRVEVEEEKVETKNATESEEKLPNGGVATRVVLSERDLNEITLELLKSFWKKQDSYISVIETRASNAEGENAVLKENEEKLKTQLSELALRERVLMRRLAAKEHDMQEYAGQLSEMKVPGGGALKSALLDPAVNFLLQRLRQELSETRTKLDDTQNELAAWKFTPDSNTGKRLMAKCRLLYQENEELGATISKGRLAKLEGDLALQKKFSEEVKKSQSDLDELLQDLDEDVEGMQSTIYYLQQELRKAKETITSLEVENGTLKSAEIPRANSPPPVNGLSEHSKWDASSEASASPSNSPSRTHDVSVVNNNIQGQRKRTSSENSDEIAKKPKGDNSHRVSDDEVITNGANDEQ